jgi:hypothetical protein
MLVAFLLAGGVFSTNSSTQDTLVAYLNFGIFFGLFVYFGQ